MAATPPRRDPLRTRPPAERERVVRLIRRRIVRGKLRPGSRLPPRTELVGPLRVSTVTLQAALDELRRDGFIRTQLGRGTFVAEHPPHRDRFALILPFDPARDAERYSTFWHVLADAAAALTARGGRRVEVFHGLGHGPESAEHRALFDDIRRHKLAGIIFASPPDRVLDSPLITEPGLPRVAIMDRPRGPLRLPRVYLHTRSFLDAALDTLAERGCRSVALLTVPRPRPFFTAYHRALAQRRLRTDRFWTQVLDPWTGVGVAQATGLLLSARPRPDGVVVADDNLVPGVLRGVAAAGLAAGRDVPLAAYANLPRRPPGPVHVTGFDITALLARCLRVLDLQRQGRTPPPVSLLRATAAPPRPAAAATPRRESR